LANYVEVILTQEEGAQENLAKSEKLSGREGYSVKAAYEILMSLYSDEN